MKLKILIAGIFLVLGIFISILYAKSILGLHFNKEMKEHSPNYDSLRVASDILLSERLQLNSMIQNLIHDSTEIVSLNGLPVSPESHGKLFWNKSNGQLLIENITDIGQQGQSFQLWAFFDNKAQSLGLINLESDLPVQRMMDLYKADYFGISIEPFGGSEEPSLEQLIMISKRF